VVLTNCVIVLSNNAFVLTIIDAVLTFPWGLNPFWLLLKSLLPAAFQLIPDFGDASPCSHARLLI
jgi:hypothetical protein